jgi:LmbE family N-acetylglucosaminyl deacetylase
MFTRVVRNLAITLACALFSPCAVLAQELTEITMDAAHLAHALDRLSTTARVLYVAAHPDDENTRFLAYLANGRHVSARYLSMTRGGGGQNLIGGEQDALLDVLRTQELLSARRIDGATQRFTRARDFGYSKSAKEALAIWGHEDVLSDVVYAIRSFRPDVIVTRFDETPPNHGHHIASAILAREAFGAAADPQRFPEQLKTGLTPWQTKRLLHNWPFWRESKPPQDAISIDVGGYDPRLGLSFGELAARSRTQHKSQGFGAAPERGVLMEHFLHVTGERATKDILEGVPGSWAERYGQAGAAVDTALKQAREQLHRDHPERASQPLTAAYAALAALPGNDPRVLSARRQSAELALLASGVFARAVSPASACVSGGKLPVKVELLLRRPAALRLVRVLFPDAQTQTITEPLRTHNKYELNATVTCPADAPASAPYWLREPALPGRYAHEQTQLEQPAGVAPLSVNADFELGGQTLGLSVPLLFSFTDRVHGERERPVQVVPPFTVTPTREAIMFPNGAAAKVSLRVRAGADAQRGRVFLELPAGYSATPTEHAVELAKAGDERVLEFSVTPPPKAAERGVERALPVAEVAGRRWSLREDLIDYPHVPTQIVLQPAALKLSPVTLSKPSGLIGYVDGSGDSIAADLVHIGAAVERLSDGDLMQGKLGRYSAIILGVRSFNTRDVLRAAQPRLMQYVHDGGTLLVQYVTRSGLSPLDVPVGPFPLEIGRGRVTDETASVTELIADHPLLRTPHKLGAKDWAGWVQERGLYFGQTWDARYQSLLSMADPDEAPEKGALLVARHGRGRYVYTGLSFFRQLPAGVPGAYRLLLNLIAADGGKTAP